jgi:Cu-processing system permease protein
MNAVLVIAGAEIRAARRNRWVLATTLLLAALALTLAFLGSAPTGTVGAGALEVTVVSLSSLTIFLVPLIALLLSYDAIVGEAERGTLLLLLSYPVERWQIVLGKFLGHVAVLAFATALGYGAAGLVLGWSEAAPDVESWAAFADMIGSSIVLGGAFLALGYLVSVAVRDRGLAAGLAIGLWLVLVLLYDMALLGVLVADQGKSITAGLFNDLLLLDPADIYRLFNLSGFAKVSLFSGMAGLSGETPFGRTALLAALAAWVVVPLTLAALLFRRKQF